MHEDGEKGQILGLQRVHLTEDIKASATLTAFLVLNPYGLGICFHSLGFGFRLSPHGYIGIGVWGLWLSKFGESQGWMFGECHISTDFDCEWAWKLSCSRNDDIA